MSVSYESAMSTLQSMFAGVDSEVIAMILQMNNGHMERTVENLLAMTTGEGGGADGGAAGGGSSSASASSVSSATTNSSSRNRSSEDATLSTAHSTLADDFLRPPSYFMAIHGGPVRKSSGNLSQMEQDMLLAQMLQDEMFLEDLRNNPDFYLEGIEQQSHAAPSSSSSSHSTAPASAAAPSRSSAAPPTAAVSSAPFVSTTASSTSSSLSPASFAPAPARSAHGDFTGIGASTGAGPHSSSMRERWSSLTSTAKKRLMSLASKLKSDRPAADGTSDDYNLFEDDPSAGDGSSAGTGGGSGGGAAPRKVSSATPLASDDVVLEESDGEEDDSSSSSDASSRARSGRKGRSGGNDALSSRLL